jgi:hypothetical protein
MARNQSGKVCVIEASCLCSQCATLNTAAALDDGDGLWNGAFAWLNRLRRLRVRYEKRADIHEAILALGCVLICWKFLTRYDSTVVCAV